MDIDSSMAIASFLFGMIIGSFMNVCIYRIPLKKSIISPPSSCTNCGNKIRFYDNIPLISYLLLSGKCRYCGQRIALIYPAVEILTGLLSFLLFIRYGPSYQYLFFFLFIATLVTISFIDIHHTIIPDVLSISGIVAGWAVSIIPGHISLVNSLIGTIAGGGSLFLVAFIYERITGRPGMGGGDLKLLAMIGAWMGWRPLPLIVLISSLTGTIVGIAFLLIAGKNFRTRIPFGPFLSLGAILYFFFGHQITIWYYQIL
ncbi:MAG: prepilin peptidase [Desulfobacteraceae bacterium 4484_190.1]|nr:MAG: prepilin peptidase [Desulfobacteraceae bacterium 4484_190.1]